MTTHHEPLIVPDTYDDDDVVAGAGVDPLQTPPPRKRYRLQLDAHTMADLADQLCYIAADAIVDGLPPARFSSSGYHFTVEDLGDDHTTARYEQELGEWVAGRRAARTARREG